MPPSPNRNKLALITGASSGIGEATSRVYASEGYDVFLVARREEKLSSLCQEISQAHDITAHYFCADLSKTNAATGIVEDLDRQELSVDILINNAGFGLEPEFTNTTWQEQADFLQLMLNAPSELAHALLPQMKKRGSGSIINIASMAGFAPGSRGHTLYAASKSALIKFSQSLDQENQKYGLNIVALCPGLTYSEFHDVNGQRESLKTLPKLLWQTSEDVAEAIYKARNSKSAIYIPGTVNKTLYLLNKLLPESLSSYILKRRHRELNTATTQPQN